jgi:hypothetical protein
MRARQRTGFIRVALRQEQAAVVGSGECAAVAAREETPPAEHGKEWSVRDGVRNEKSRAPDQQHIDSQRLMA